MITRFSALEKEQDIKVCLSKFPHYKLQVNSRPQFQPTNLDELQRHYFNSWLKISKHRRTVKLTSTSHRTLKRSWKFFLANLKRMRLSRRTLQNSITACVRLVFKKLKFRLNLMSLRCCTQVDSSLFRMKVYWRNFIVAIQSLQHESISRQRQRTYSNILLLIRYFRLLKQWTIISSHAANTCSANAKLVRKKHMFKRLTSIWRGLEQHLRSPKVLVSSRRQHNCRKRIFDHWINCLRYRLYLSNRRYLLCKFRWFVQRAKLAVARRPTKCTFHSSASKLSFAINRWNKYIETRHWANCRQRLASRHDCRRLLSKVFSNWKYRNSRKVSLCTGYWRLTSYSSIAWHRRRLLHYWHLWRQHIQRRPPEQQQVLISPSTVIPAVVPPPAISINRRWKVSAAAALNASSRQSDSNHLNIFEREVSMLARRNLLRRTFGALLSSFTTRWRTIQKNGSPFDKGEDNCRYVEKMSMVMERYVIAYLSVEFYDCDLACLLLLD